MIFTAPLVLLGLAVLPGLYFLLRLTPPAAKRIAFPPLALLRGLNPAERTPNRMPLWLLLLRLAACCLVILGLAGPCLHPPPALPGNGPVLLVIDNGWAAAPNWPETMGAARQIIGAAAQAHRAVALLATARDPGNAAPAIRGVMTANIASQLLSAISPQPWPADRAGAAAALENATRTTRIYLADGITDAPGFATFMRALHPDRIIAPAFPASLLLPPSLDENGNLVAHLASPPPGAAVLAQQNSGGNLAEAKFSAGTARVSLPLVLSNEIARLVVPGPPAAGNVYLLDNFAHGSIIGLASSSPAAELPFLGALYFVSRAIPTGSQLVTGDIASLIHEKVSVIILADLALTPEQLRQAQGWIEAGGEIIRFAGPITAGTLDGLAPDPLLAGDRRLGGTLTWTTPQNFAPFPADSPLAGLRADAATTVSRQILADPTQLDPGTVWARLADGTPLVLGKTIGKGLLVSVLTTANADWSNLPLAGIYPAMLARLIALAHGAPLQPGRELPMLQALNGYGDLIAPGPEAASVTAGSLPQITVSPLHPPGIYGGDGMSVALNVGGHVPPPVPAILPHAEKLGQQRPPLNFGNALLGAAALLFSLDLLISLGVRGLIRPRRSIALWRRKRALLLLFLAGQAILLLPRASAQTERPIPPAALQTELAYIKTGDAATDQRSADALNYLSALVSARSSAQLASPAAVSPDSDDLNFYPMIYWPVLASAPAPSGPACAALNAYMQHGGLLLMDSQGSDADGQGSGAGFAPGAGAALRRAAACLYLPPLEALTTANSIAHSFYIIQSFPGKFTGSPVLIASAAARDADGVTPIIIGQNDWAGAWARDENGDPEQTPLPGGEDQRVTADRFGTNLVIYALTGDYKADQSNLPAFLDKLGH